MGLRAAILTAATMLGLSAGPAFAVDHSGFGTPGTHGCVGQSTAFFAQIGNNVGEGIPHGIGGVAKLLDVSPTDLHESAAVNCAAVTP